ncbi:unnamed protein product [Hydatigera taeniaeformis]|uniref:Zinc metalloproteinase YIL108W n=1 Tax=Hydatigena taeniaeformis TaxID=6205 RepID=A0A0R3X4X9_HYDTA|nr:unnamed protein product [Hydatigera taeniaeformis]
MGLNNVSVCCPHVSYNCAITRVLVGDTRPYVRCIYIVFKGHDGSFQAPPNISSDSGSACRRLGLAVRLLQTLTAETIFAETGCRLAVWCIHSEMNFQEAQSLSAFRLWECLARELDTIFWEDRDRAKWLAVVSCTEYESMTGSKPIPHSHEEVIAMTKGYCALGTGGLALIGSGTLYTWPESAEDIGTCLSNTSKVNRREYLDDSGYRGTYWANYTTALGTMLHELGHCFDLDHNFEGIMRRGGDDLNLVLAFPPPGSSSRPEKVNLVNKSTFQVRNAYDFRRLSILQISRVTFYENASRVVEAAQDQSGIPWGRCDTVKDCGGAFWGKEIAQFLSFHRWFIEFPKYKDYRGTELKE